MENATRNIYGKRRTNPKFIALEHRPINLIIVKLDKSPVSGEFVGLDGDLDLLRVKDEGNRALVRRGVFFDDLAVDRFHLLHLARRLSHQSQVLIATLSHVLTFSLDGVAKPAKDIVPGINTLEAVADSGHQRLDSVVVAHGTGRNDFLTTRTTLLVGHARVVVDRRRTSDVSAGEDRDTVVVLREAEVESGGPFVVRVLAGRDREAESRGERLAHAGDSVDEGG